MAEVIPNISSLNFDLRAIAEKAAKDPGCLRADLGHIKIGVDPVFQSIMQDQVRKENFNYAPTLGLPTLIDSLNQYDKEVLAHFQNPSTLITSGGQAALFASIKTWVGAGHFILTDQAYYPPYQRISHLLDASLYPFDFNQILRLERSKLKQVKMLLINSPNNPTGEVYNEAVLKELAQIARVQDWIVVEDAVYDRIYYDQPPTSISKFCPERTLIIQSASKNLALAGARIGWIHGEKKHVIEVAKVHRNMNSCPNTFFQNTLARYLPISNEHIGALRLEMKKRLNLFRQALDELEWEYSLPKGAIYLWAKPTDCNDTRSLVHTMIEQARISAMPGILFGNHSNLLRFCFGALTPIEIEEFARRLTHFRHG